MLAPIPFRDCNISDARRRNLLLLLHQFTEQQVARGVPAKGIVRAFADQINVSAVTLSQLKSDRNVSDKVARQIEALSGKEAFWMDVPHEDQVATPAEEAFIALARAAWRATDAKGRRAMLGLAKKGFISEPL